MQVDAVIEKLKTDVPALNDRVRGAGDFAALMRSGSEPSAPVFAHVLYNGIVGVKKPDVATGVYRQETAEGINIMLSIRTSDATGQKALDDVSDLTHAILHAICGWAPSNETGVFQFVRSGLVSFTKGMMRWQLDFTITDQLRITS